MVKTLEPLNPEPLNLEARLVRFNRDGGNRHR
jgi:hypothetical protein